MKVYDLKYYKKTHAVVIGGGVIGTSITYHLAQRGIDTILVEKNDIASGTSGACDGFVFLQSKKPGYHLNMALKSTRMMEMLSSELTLDIEYRKNGGMIIVKSPEDMPDIERLVKRQQKHGLDVQWLNSQEARKLEPHLSPQVVGATYSSMDAQVNSMMLCFAFAKGAEEMGGEILTHTEVTDIIIEKNKIQGIITSEGAIKSDIVVNAAGVYAPVVANMAGVKLPIIPRRGQILVTEYMPPMFSRVMICSKYIVSKFKRSPLYKDETGVGLAIEQTKAGTILIGSTREFAGYNKNNTPGGIQSILKHACEFFPTLKEISIIRTFAGLRPYTSDGMPILGEIGPVKGFITASGHEGDGIALSPVTGFMIAELIEKGKLPK
ncbi:FAD-dependent oxidoreductase [Candidatus Poribacteria bacterium]|nr:FAD-dependent oxidoreductase [Candidatus Poribacteria bacterium]